MPIYVTKGAVAAFACLSPSGAASDALPLCVPEKQPARKTAGPKNSRENIEDDELAHWHTVASAFLNLSPGRLNELIVADDLREVPSDD